MDFAVVLVTFNRLNFLKKALAAYASQKKLPKYILVVDNASTDGTSDFLKIWKKEDEGRINKIVVTANNNLGGSGGFALGVSKASNLDVDFLFLSDDDAIPKENMFFELEKTYNKIGDKKIAALCTSIYNNGKLELMHRCKINNNFLGVKLKGVSEKEYNKKYFQLDILTFVGACIKKSTIEKIGNVKSEYFIYFDDTEYSMRINKIGNIYCIPKSIMVHNVGSDRRSSWKDYYDTRNWIDLVKNYFPKSKLYEAIIVMYLKRVSLLAKLFRNRSVQHRIMCRKAIRDGLNGRLGVNESYKPGTKNIEKW